MHVRVAMVAESFLPAVNGVANSVVRAVRHLERRGHEVLVIAPRPGPTVFESAPVIRTKAIPLPFYRTFHVGVARSKLRDALDRFRPDVLHVASPAVLGAAGITAAVDANIATVAVFQTDIAGYAELYGHRWARPAIWQYLRRVHNRADLTLAPCLTMATELRSRGFISVDVWGRGVDTERFHPRFRSEELRRRLSPNGEWIVGYVGRLAPEKEVDLLAHLADLPRCRLVIVGDGPDRRRLEQRLPRAQFVGFQKGESLSRLYASMDVFVHPGRTETFCQTIQEAQASGVPTVAPAVGGPLDLIEHGSTGLLWQPSDPSTLRSATARLLSDANLSRRVAHAGLASVQTRTWDVVGDRLIEHYRSVAGRPAMVEAA